MFFSHRLLEQQGVGAGDAQVLMTSGISSDACEANCLDDILRRIASHRFNHRVPNAGARFTFFRHHGAVADPEFDVRIEWIRQIDAAT